MDLHLPDRLRWGSRCTRALATLLLCLAAPVAWTAPRLPVRVVVVTTFEIGQDSGDTPGEFQYWVELLPLGVRLPPSPGARSLRYNRQKQVLGIVVGAGSINSASATMALGLDPRFDLTHAYWLVAGIAGVNPNTGSVGSAAWAEWVVDRDLVHEVDAREMPADWSTGLVPLTRSRPFEGTPPEPGMFSPNAYHLDAGLVDWAYRLTAGIVLADTPDLQAIRSGYEQPQAGKPPHVMKGDEISANNWWVGSLMNRAAEDWMRYWTGGQGVAVTTAMEDCGVIHSLQMLAASHRVDATRVLVLRTASNYAVPPRGQSAAGLIAAESSSDSATSLSGFLPSLEAAYLVGSRVVVELSDHWARYGPTRAGAAP